MSSPRSSGSAPTRRSRRALIGVGALLAVVALAAGAVVGTVLAQQGQTSAAPATAAPTATASRAAPADAGSARPVVVIPEDCTQLYSPAMLEFLTSTGLPLNDPSVSGSLGTDDPELQQLIQDNPTLHCAWGGAGEYGLNTNVTVVSPETQDAVLARLGALGFECSDDGDGSRCSHSESWEQGAGGENHVVRDGVWLATDWVNFGPTNYTGDIVATLFGS
ncbi:hypothetical protein [Mycetocola reblochoni]|uniref:Uncharacterized protein n=2 Tax=Mycetocola reblochoni TaxID=331618 RepID=A0A1R4IDM5_9MICO|nr:hypothetical protein [Mycetocola reblochoni]RLP69109.1 hypothetical protein D9V30_07265 [Mycetocola reblochoni]SJN17674.1 hypothetical protein FM119_01095 [Mycetocola reblochoni REB411]